MIFFIKITSMLYLHAFCNVIAQRSCNASLWGSPATAFAALLLGVLHRKPLHMVVHLQVRSGAALCASVDIKKISGQLGLPMDKP